MSSDGIRKAIVPAAGFGTRLRPLTQAIPKEMLPIGRKPVLQYVLEELRAAGIEEVLIVISPGKEMIQNYFGDGTDFAISIKYTLQNEMKGLGDAVLHGEDWAGDDHFVVAFGDCIIEGCSPPPLKRLVDTHVREQSDATVLAERIDPLNCFKYGILDPGESDTKSASIKLKDIVEKPQPENSPSNLAVAARWILSPPVFKYIRNSAPESSGEVNLTDPIRLMIREGASAWASPLTEGETRLDIGGWESYLLAAARAACEDDEFGTSIRSRLGDTNAV